ncbi:serine/threonine-protein kinase [Streptomyces sp. B6B3]|uniref:serine/threonine-protein kinase n=1 Tax=Streptomyces sp. B6B3 TaxID=3153570 RepID=UPI00325DF2D2
MHGGATAGHPAQPGGVNATEAAGVFQPLEPDDPPAVGRYPLAARLGAGGMGRVYLSYTPGGRALAIKVVKPELGADPRFRQRFRQEVQAAERVRGVYTAPVVDSDTEGPRPWLATAYVPGPSLSDAVTRHGPLPVQTVLPLLAGIAEALEAIHAAGLVHRDLKPSNVLLAADGPRVIDFGIAQAVEATSSLTSTGVVVGTPTFMSPEQAAGGTVGPATDVFALGHLAAYAATGSPAFGEGTSHAVLYRIVHEWPDLSAVPEPLRTLAGRCLAKDPAARPSATEVVGLCRAALPQAHPSGPGGWLPAVVAAELAGRASAPPPGPAPAGGQPAATPVAPAAPETALPVAPPTPSAARTAADAAPPARRRAVWVGAALTALVLLGAGVTGAVIWTGGDSTEEATDDPSTGSNEEREAGQGENAGRPSPEPGTTEQSPPERAPTEDSTPEEESSTDPEPQPDPEPEPEPEPATYRDIDLPAGYHLYFGEEPVAPRESGSWNMTEIDFRYFTGGDVPQLRTAEGNEMVLLDGQRGSLDVCRADTRYTETVGLDVVKADDQLCVRTAAGHVALVTVTGRSPETDPSDYLSVDVTVWRDAL